MNIKQLLRSDGNSLEPGYHSHIFPHPYRTVSAAFDRAIRATVNCTEVVENLAANLESQ